MPLVNLSTVLKEAQEKKYAVGSFNLINLDFLQAIVRAAEKKRSPVILSIAEVHLKYVYLDVICPAIKGDGRSIYDPDGSASGSCREF